MSKIDEICYEFGMTEDQGKLFQEYQFRMSIDHYYVVSSLAHVAEIMWDLDISEIDEELSQDERDEIVREYREGNYGLGGSPWA